MWRKNLLMDFIILYFLINPRNEFAQNIDFLPFEDSFSFIDSTLKIDLEQLLIDLCKDYHTHYTCEIQNIRFKPVKTNFSHLNGDEIDYLIKANLEAEWWKDNTTIILIFIKVAGKYELSFKWLGSNKSYDVTPRLIEVDEGPQKALLIEADYSGNFSTTIFVEIWKYMYGDFITIFEEGLVENYGFFPYSYTNEYHFAKNENNSKFLDIDFRIKTEITVYGEEILSEFKESELQSDPEIPEPFEDEVIYTFNGKKYVPNKEVYDYRKYIRLLLKED